MNFFAATNTGINKASTHQILKVQMIYSVPVRLAPGSRRNIDTEPTEILKKGLFKLGAATTEVMVLQAKADLSFKFAGKSLNVEQVQDMPKMEMTCWARSKTGSVGNVFCEHMSLILHG
jgi:hypothetical protein